MKKAVVVGQPQYQTGTDVLIPNRQPNMTNESTDLNTTSSEENLSAKYKNPRVKQDIPAEGRNQYQ